MKNFTAILFTVLIFCACNQTSKKLKERITNADSIAVNYFKGDGSMDTVVAVKIVKDKKEIEQLAGFITAGSASLKNKCGYDGSIHFFKSDRVIQDVFFSSNKEDCRQFVFISGGKQAATALPAEAAYFLSAIKNK